MKCQPWLVEYDNRVVQRDDAGNIINALTVDHAYSRDANINIQLFARDLAEKLNSLPDFLEE